jgi:hypothetical protein
VASASPYHHRLQPGVFTSDGSFPPRRVLQGFLSESQLKASSNLDSRQDRPRDLGACVRDQKPLYIGAPRAQISKKLTETLAHRPHSRAAARQNFGLQ